MYDKTKFGKKKSVTFCCKWTPHGQLATCLQSSIHQIHVRFSVFFLKKNTIYQTKKTIDSVVIFLCFLLCPFFFCIQTKSPYPHPHNSYKFQTPNNLFHFLSEYTFNINWKISHGFLHHKPQLFFKVASHSQRSIPIFPFPLKLAKACNFSSFFLSFQNPFFCLLLPHQRPCLCSAIAGTHQAWKRVGYAPETRFVWQVWEVWWQVCPWDSNACTHWAWGCVPCPYCWWGFSGHVTKPRFFSYLFILRENDRFFWILWSNFIGFLVADVCPLQCGAKLKFCIWWV